MSAYAAGGGDIHAWDNIMSLLPKMVELKPELMMQNETVLKQFQEALFSDEMINAFGEMDTFRTLFMNWIQPDPEDVDNIKEAYRTIFEGLKEPLQEGLGFTDEEFEEAIGTLIPNVGNLTEDVDAWWNSLYDGQKQGIEQGRELNEVQKDSVATASEAVQVTGENAQSIHNLQQEEESLAQTSKNVFQPITEEAKEGAKATDGLTDATKRSGRAFNDDGLKRQNRSLSDYSENLRTGTRNAGGFLTSAQRLTKTILGLGDASDQTGDQSRSLGKTVGETAQGITSELYDAGDAGNALTDTLVSVGENADQSGTVDVDTDEAQRKASVLLSTLQFLAKLLSFDFKTDKPDGEDNTMPKGGGGKSRKQREEEEAKRAAEEAKRAQEEAYREALGQIDHLKKMDQLSGEQEIKMLLEVQRVHAQTAEQRMDMEERIYAVRKELAEKQYRDALDEIDHLMALDQMSAAEDLARLLEIQQQFVGTEEMRREMAEKVYASRKALQQKEYDDALEDIDRKRRMNRISAEEEIKLLETVALVNAQTGEQRLDIEERLYEARKALAEQQYSDALSEIEHMLRMDEIGAEEELTMLEDVEAQYAKTAEQKREMEERIYQARKQLQEDALNTW